MRVLVTGSHGFIGRNLVERLEEEGHEVFQWDLKIGKDVIDDEFAFPKVDRIYHLACLNQEASELDHQASRRNNLLTTLKMANLAYLQGARLIYTSTASVYGATKRLPTPSTAEVHPKTIYAWDKLLGEWELSKFFKSELDYSILRLSNVYGPHQTLENPYCGVVGKFIEQAVAGKPLTVIGDGSQTRDFTYVGDVVGHLLDPPSGGPYNVSTGKETSVFELANAIGSLVGSNHYGDVVIIPGRPVDGIQRRCLVPDLLCLTSLSEGLRKTLDLSYARSVS